MAGTAGLTEHWVEPELHTILVQWAKWCRGNYLPSEFWVQAGSIETGYLPPAGDVFLSAADALQKGLKTTQERFSDPQAARIEVIVMRLPEKNRKALRLHYVAHKQLPMSHKRRLLGVTFDGYWELVKLSALMMRNCLHIQQKSVSVSGKRE